MAIRRRCNGRTCKNGRRCREHLWFDVMHRGMRYRMTANEFAVPRMEPGKQRPEPHSHPFDQIALVMEGALNLEIDGKVMQMPAGSICHIPKNAMHSGWPAGDKPVVIAREKSTRIKLPGL